MVTVPDKKASSMPQAKVPAFTVVSPVKVLAPERVRAPPPFFAMPPEPLPMTPLKVVLYAPSIVNRYVPLAISPLKVISPEEAFIVLAVTSVMAPAPTLAAVELLL